LRCRSRAALKAAADAAGIKEAFMTSIAVGTVETFCRGQDACYKSAEAFLEWGKVLLVDLLAGEGTTGTIERVRSGRVASPL
jgi:hypothetical protein